MGMFLTDANCIAQRKYVNLPAWDKYDGNGLSIFCDDVGADHAPCVVDIIQTILPKAKVYSGNIGYQKIDDKILACIVSCKELGVTMAFDDFVTKYDISLINNSTDGGKGTTILPEALYMRDKIKQYNLIFCGCAGNDNGSPCTQKYNGACIIVTSCHLNDKGVPIFSNESIGPNIDFAMFNGFQPGTSFASPFLLGMAGKLRCKYPNITQEEVKAYFKAHCEDLLVDGFDIQSGWGLPKMGEPKTIVKMQIGRNVMTVDGVDVILDQPPVIDCKTNRTLIPVRAISEALGASVEWDQATKTITIRR